MRIVVFGYSAAWFCLTAVALCAAEPVVVPRPTEIQLKAQKFIGLLVKGDYTAAVKDFDKTMTQVLPPKKLEELWKSVPGRLGDFQKQLGVRQERLGKYDIVFVTCVFAKAKFDIKVVFNADKQIAGLAFVQTPSPVKYKAPDYVNAKSFRESEVKFGLEKWALPGTLTLPVGDGPFPAVVLVHGSGPNDRDETIGANKPFRDLAWGLASRGVAVLRYEKRTRVHGAKMVAEKSPLTVKEEVIEDVLAAVQLLRKHKGVNARKIFVLGHSLGATLVPAIGSQDASLAGLIALAGATVPLEDHILRQLTYIFSLDGPPSDEQKAELEKIKKQAARLKDPKLSPKTPSSELPLGVAAAYWLSLRDYSPEKMVSHVKQPMLVLQGARDYQVIMKDFQGWKKLLAGRKNVRFKSYPKLNHLFSEGEGKSRPSEYEKVGHVARAVIEDVAAWIKKQ